ncbi:hypothetical protein [Roseomonas indoligenes]|uniref:DUF2946 domain-containing protein n=1 Tax=Roseomonas indoligenes TaxID=2820811 RepID=A0A940N848_9PROT|nr:hypothetical protein [Pararoseomonas indoligenes]MBP0495802.1 hypothetical protein [Pararoseomonas indoligenes]
MLALPTSLAARILRRVLSVTMCVLMLLSVAVSTDAGASTVPAPAGQVGIVLTDRGPGDEPLQPDALPCECAHHLCNKVVPVPPIIVVGSPAVARPDSMPVRAPTPVLLSGLTELPPRPPRA